jgi:DNA-binding CsgD family transcriptional regulator
MGSSSLLSSRWCRPGGSGTWRLAGGTAGAAAAGEAGRYLSAAQLGITIASSSRPAGREPVSKPSLSPREKQVLGMVVMGFTNAEIAAALYVAETTVKEPPVLRVRKAGRGSRTEATALILDPERGLGSGILAISEDGFGAGSPDRAPSP